MQGDDFWKSGGNGNGGARPVSRAPSHSGADFYVLEPSRDHVVEMTERTRSEPGAFIIPAAVDERPRVDEARHGIHDANEKVLTRRRVRRRSGNTVVALQQA